MFWYAWCSLLWSEGFSSSLDLLHGGPGTSKLQFWKKILHLFSAVNFSKIFGHQNPGSGSGLVFSLKCWIRIRNQRNWIRNTAWKPWKKTAGSGSAIQSYGTADPDRYQNVTDEEHWKAVFWKMQKSDLRLTASQTSGNFGGSVNGKLNLKKLYGGGGGQLSVPWTGAPQFGGRWIHTAARHFLSISV